MNNYAVAEIAGLQYKLIKGEKIETERVVSKKDAEVSACRSDSKEKHSIRHKTFKTDKVLLVKDGKNLSVGTPYVKGASVTCEVLKDFLADKKVSYKYKKRKDSHWKKGHRQQMSLLKVSDIKVE